MNSLGSVLLRLCEDAGIPLRIEYASIVLGRVKGTFPRVAPYSPHWVSVNILRLGMAKLADEVFDREFLAERTREEIDDLVETYRAALERTVAMIDRREWSEAKAYSSIAKTLPGDLVPSLLQVFTTVAVQPGRCAAEHLRIGPKAPVSECSSVGGNAV